MNDKKYNGWTNYATWRVNLEIFDGYCTELNEEATANDCEAFAGEVIDASTSGSEGLALDYARAFLNQVNWQEIADNINNT